MSETRKNKPAESKKDSQQAPPSDLDFEKALMFFHAYMYGPLHERFPRVGGAAEVLWI